jgi:hypothetical protein
VPRRFPLYVHRSLDPFADYFLADVPLQRVLLPADIPWTSRATPGFLALEGASNPVGATVFRREHGRLWNIARQRYFEISVVPITRADRNLGLRLEEISWTAEIPSHR